MNRNTHQLKHTIIHHWIGFMEHFTRYNYCFFLKHWKNYFKFKACIQVPFILIKINWIIWFTNKVGIKPSWQEDCHRWCLTNKLVGASSSISAHNICNGFCSSLQLVEVVDKEIKAGLTRNWLHLCCIHTISYTNRKHGNALKHRYLQTV